MTGFSGEVQGSQMRKPRLHLQVKQVTVAVLTILAARGWNNYFDDYFMCWIFDSDAIVNLSRHAKYSSESADCKR